jgi:FKBP-type peptidyl-prolyl cis-trans isomerase
MTMRRRISLSVLAAVTAGAASCNGAPTPLQPIVFQGPPDLVITDLRVGEGDTLAAGQTATVHYSLWLYDPAGTDSKGTLVQNTRQTSAALTGVQIPIASGEVIEGWVQGMPGMKVGGLRRLIIPPSLGFGAVGSGPIPPNAWLVFDVELLGIAD